MRLLLDTHFALWLTSGVNRLTPAERRIVEQGAASTSISVVSLWELRLKWDKLGAGKDRRGLMDPVLVYGMALKSGWRVLSVEPAHIFSRLKTPPPHKDPFDEMLLMQAQEEGLRLLTRDRKLIGHPLAAPLH